LEENELNMAITFDELNEEDMEDPYKSSSAWATKMFDATWPWNHTNNLKPIRMNEVEQLLAEPWTFEDYRKLVDWFRADYSWGMRSALPRKRTRLRLQEVNDIVVSFLCKN
tara:strand:+ start:207 stop:539 length:333 start_codon:yes stop_codon:yes gene_type:complete